MGSYDDYLSSVLEEWRRRDEMINGRWGCVVFGPESPPSEPVLTCDQPRLPLTDELAEKIAAALEGTEDDAYEVAYQEFQVDTYDCNLMERLHDHGLRGCTGFDYHSCGTWLRFDLDDHENLTSSYPRCERCESNYYEWLGDQR